MAREPYVNIEEAAKYLLLSRRSLDKFISEAKAGVRRFPYYQDKPNGKLTFKLSELDLWRFDNKKS